MSSYARLSPVTSITLRGLPVTHFVNTICDAPSAIGRCLAFKHEIEMDVHYVCIASVSIVIAVFPSDIKCEDTLLPDTKLALVVLMNVRPDPRLS